MSKSKSLKTLIANMGGESRLGKGRKKGKKGRKVGKGVHKLSHSKWGSYAALINHQKSRRLRTMGRRFCKGCDVQFHSHGAVKRHICEI